MRPLVVLAVMVALVAGGWDSPAAGAATPVPPAPSPNAVMPGAELAQTISLITGVAISPLLGTGAVGAWRFFQARTPRERANLPWFAQPWFWIPALVIVTACFLKDTVGIGAPRLLKKPLDAAEVIEHKISGLIAAGAFVPLMAAIFHQPDPPPALITGGGLAAAIDLSLLGNVIMVSLMMITFFIVCLASSAINILILLSPFRIVDLALKIFRLFLLFTVMVTAVVNPWLGAAWAIVITVLAWFIAGWSFRLSHLGWVFIWDLATQRWRRFVPNQTRNRVFLSRKFSEAPARTYGTLVRDQEGHLVLAFHPWLILPQRTLRLPRGEYALAKGLLYSEIVRVEGPSLKSTILLPQRYRSHEAELVSAYGFSGVRDAGIRAAFRWLMEFVGFRSRQRPMAAPSGVPG